MGLLIIYDNGYGYVGIEGSSATSSGSTDDTASVLLLLDNHWQASDLRSTSQSSKNYLLILLKGVLHSTVLIPHAKQSPCVFVLDRLILVRSSKAHNTAYFHIDAYQSATITTRRIIT